MARAQTRSRTSANSTALASLLLLASGSSKSPNAVNKRKTTKVLISENNFTKDSSGSVAAQSNTAKLSIKLADPITQAPILEDVYKHLIDADVRMKRLIEKYPCANFTPEATQELIDPFMALSGSIISQQVSGAAASSVRRRFIELFNPYLPASVDNVKELEYFPSPQSVAVCDILFLRSAGLSMRKAEYIHGLAGKFASGELSASMLRNASYEELVEKLTAVRGIGLWTVEMFAIFGLKRWDVFSMGDLAIQ